MTIPHSSHRLSLDDSTYDAAYVGSAAMVVFNERRGAARRPDLCRINEPPPKLSNFTQLSPLTVWFSVAALQVTPNCLNFGLKVVSNETHIVQMQASCGLCLNAAISGGELPIQRTFVHFGTQDTSPGQDMGLSSKRGAQRSRRGAAT